MGTFSTQIMSSVRFLKLCLVNRTGAVLFWCAVMAATASTQTLTTVHSFNGTDGIPDDTANLIQATNGNFYGTTYGGGANTCLVQGVSSGCGTIFKITPSGQLQTLYNFCAQDSCSDGSSPQSGVVQGSNGAFYGTTSTGGVNGAGTIFRITPSGTLTTLYSFCSLPNCGDGSDPVSPLIQATDGNFYGTTSTGGLGTIFRITPQGKLTTLYGFCSVGNCADGLFPISPLTQGVDGNLYGTTLSGGANGDFGTIFKITLSGVLTTLHSFNGPDGHEPAGPLIQAADGTFYGTTIEGGTNDGGTIFRVTATGVLKTLYSFCSQSDCADGEGPRQGLVQATDGEFYGTTFQGGVNSEGTIFKITPKGVLTTLYKFCAQSGCPDGSSPPSALLQSTNGIFYGTTVGGGTHQDGTVFSLSVGLRPFVETQTTSGKVGSVVKILGTNLTGITQVTFNGIGTTFIAISKSEVTATVPTGATTGPVLVTTSQGVLKSNTVFRVTPH